VSGLLISFIRTLHETDTGQREDEKKKLEQQFKESDSRLDHMVSDTQVDLANVMTTYSAVSARLNKAKNKLATVKECLVTCQELLNCKRDELKKLWLDGIEQKHILQLLNQIEEIQQMRDQINGHMARKQFYQATSLLIRSRDLLNTSLKNVEALAEVKTELESKSSILFTRILEDLTSQLYLDSTWDVLQMQRVGSNRDMAFQRAGSGRNSSDWMQRGSGKKSKESGREGSGKGVGSASKGFGRRPRDFIKSNFLLAETGNSSNQISVLAPADEGAWNQALENPQTADQELGPAFSILIDMECLTMLNKLPDAVESLTADLQNQLFQILTRTTHQLIESGKYSQGDKRLLGILFSAVVAQLNHVVDAYKLAARVADKAVKRHKADFARIDLPEVWSKVQSVVQVLLTDYLDFKSSTQLGSLNAQQSNNTLSEPAADINSFFVRRKTNFTRPKRSSLFRFDSSSTALSLNDFVRENNGNPVNGQKEEKVLVCDANPHNITLIFNQLLTFIQQVEKELSCPTGSHCNLYAFLMDYIKDVFLGQIHVDISNSLNSASQSLDAWKSVSDSEVLRSYRVSRPLLQSTVSVWKSIEELGEMMVTLPLYSTHFLTIICNVLVQYKDICCAAYRGLVQPDAEDKRIISAQWAKDEDISRFLKSLPNWETKETGSNQVGEELATQVDKQNRKETEILVQNLGSSEITSHEILSDSNQLRSLAQLHESLDWFARSVLGFSKTLEKKDLPESTLQTLISLAKEFVELADVCLLVLHLEVRVHCFFYLLPLWRGPSGGQYFGGPDSTDPCSEVIQLNRDLLGIEEALDTSMQPKKIQYIFEGVSHVISAILISSATSIKKINKNGIKKMCRNIFSVQQTLTSSITGRREVALDQAKTFYELMNLSQGEVLENVMERGALFSQLDYINALQLINRSQVKADNDGLVKNMDKLAEILNSMGNRPAVQV